jgi:hypothetical protein
MLDFMGSDKLGSLVTTLSNHPSLLRGDLWRGTEVAHDDGRAKRSVGIKISSREQRPDFDLVGILRRVVVRETHGAKRMTCCSGSSPTECTSIRFESLRYSRI